MHDANIPQAEGWAGTYCCALWRNIAMAQEFIVQIETNGKWGSAYRGTDKAAAESTYHSSVAEFGSDAIRILRSDGTKEDGSVIWATAEAPIKTGPEPKPEPEPEPEPNSTTTERVHSMTETLQSTENAQSETDYTIFNIHKVKKPEDVGGFSTVVFWLLFVFGCLLVPIIGLVVGFWKRKDPAPVKRTQAKALLAISVMMMTFNVASALLSGTSGQSGGAAIQSTKTLSEIISGSPHTFSEECQRSRDCLATTRRNGWRLLSSEQIFAAWGSCQQLVQARVGRRVDFPYGATVTLPTSTDRLDLEKLISATNYYTADIYGYVRGPRNFYTFNCELSASGQVTNTEIEFDAVRRG